MQNEQNLVYNFWNNHSCGEELYLDGSDQNAYREQARIRYECEPMIHEFARFELYGNQKVLEIGVGLGAEHQQFAESGAILSGIDITERAISHTSRRLNLFELSSDLRVANAEFLPYEDESFDLVYSWGVLHHTPNTEKAINEVYRVLKKNAEAKIMIYHKYSIVGYMLWLRYALLKFKPLTSLNKVYARYLESPGTKAFSIHEAQQLFKQFKTINIQCMLTHGDLLTSNVGQRHKGFLLTFAKKLWPRWFIRSCLKSHGLFMLINATK